MRKVSCKAGFFVAAALLAVTVACVAPMKASAEALPPTGSTFRLLGTRMAADACFVRVEIVNNTGGERDFPRLVSVSPGLASNYEVRPYAYTNPGRNVVETKFTRNMVGAKYLLFIDAWTAHTFQVAGGQCDASQLPDQPSPWREQ